jgi:hypothetical protein
MKTIPLWLILVLLLVSGPAHALRCGARLITEGDTRLEVRERCGEPTQTDQWEEERTVTVHDDNHNLLRRRKVSVQVEEWIYNFGPHRFMQRLLFHDGKLVDIESLGRGF